MIPSLSNLYDAAFEIRTLLMPFAFVLCVIGIGEMGWRAGSDTRAILGALLKTILVVGLLAGYPAAMDGGQKAFVEMRSKFTNARDAKFVQLLRSRIENQPSDSWTDLGKVVPAAIGMFFQGIGRFMLIVLTFFSKLRHCRADCRFAVATRLFVPFAHPIARHSVRCHVPDDPALACGDLFGGHCDRRYQRHSLSPNYDRRNHPDRAERIHCSKLAPFPVYHGVRRHHHGVLLPECPFRGWCDHEGRQWHNSRFAGGHSRHHAGRRTHRRRGTHRSGSRRNFRRISRCSRSVGRSPSRSGHRDRSWANRQRCFRLHCWKRSSSSAADSALVSKFQQCCKRRQSRDGGPPDRPQCVRRRG